jgi:hypothetical protein
MTWTRLCLLAVVASVLAGCSGPSTDPMSNSYSKELNEEMPKPKDDTPLFDPPPNVLSKDGETRSPKGD